MTCGWYVDVICMMCRRCADVICHLPVTTTLHKAYRLPCLIWCHDSVNFSVWGNYQWPERSKSTINYVSFVALSNFLTIFLTVHFHTSHCWTFGCGNHHLFQIIENICPSAKSCLKIYIRTFEFAHLISHNWPIVLSWKEFQELSLYVMAYQY